MVAILSLKKFLNSNRVSFLVFFITLIVYTAFLLIQIGIYDEKVKNIPGTDITNFWTGDMPKYVSIASTIIYHQSVYLEQHFLNQFPEENRIDPIMKWPEKYSEPHKAWHAYQRSDGHWISNHDPGIAYLIVPGYYLGGIFGAAMTVVVSSSLTSVFIYKFSSKYSSIKIGFLTTMIFSFGTMWLVISNYIYPDVIIPCFVIISLYLIFEKYQSNFSMGLAGAILAVGILIKISFVLIDVIILPLVVIFFLKGKIRPRPFVFFISFFILLLLMVGLNNLYTHNSIIGGGYTSNILIAMTEGRQEDNTLPLTRDNTRYGLETIIEIFFGRHHGLFVFFPIVMLFVLGIIPLWKENKSLLLTMGFLSLSIILGYHFIGGTIGPLTGGSPLFRYYEPILIFMSIPFAMGMQIFSKNWLYRGGLILLSLSSFTFSIIFSIYRFWNFSHTKPKMILVHDVYFGLDTILPSLGPIAFKGKTFPMHLPLDFTNLIFLIVMITLLGIGMFLPLFSKKIIKSKN